MIVQPGAQDCQSSELDVNDYTTRNTRLSKIRQPGTESWMSMIVQPRGQDYQRSGSQEQRAGCQWLYNHEHKTINDQTVRNRELDVKYCTTRRTRLSKIRQPGTESWMSMIVQPWAQDYKWSDSREQRAGCQWLYNQEYKTINDQTAGNRELDVNDCTTRSRRL